jgi:hypothetical protein
MDKPVAELAAYFGSKSRLPDQDLVRLTAAARAAGSRWEAIAAVCGIWTYEDLAGVVDRITGETGADPLDLRWRSGCGQPGCCTSWVTARWPQSPGGS